jgi:hypothetical protein
MMCLIYPVGSAHILLFGDESVALARCTRSVIANCSRHRIEERVRVLSPSRARRRICHSPD